MSTNAGARRVDIPLEVWNLGSSDSTSTPFRHGFQGGRYSGDIQKVRGPKSTTPVTDLVRMCTARQFLITQMGNSSFQSISILLYTNVSTEVGVFQINIVRWLGIWEVRGQIAPLSTSILYRAVRWRFPEISGRDIDHSRNRSGS